VRQIEIVIHDFDFNTVNYCLAFETSGRCRLYGDSCPLESLASFLSPKRITFDEASKQNFAPYKVGDTFGPT